MFMHVHIAYYQENALKIQALLSQMNTSTPANE